MNSNNYFTMCMWLYTFNSNNDFHFQLSLHFYSLFLFYIWGGHIQVFQCLLIALHAVIILGRLGDHIGYKRMNLHPPGAR